MSSYRVTFPFDSFKITYSDTGCEVYIHFPEDCPAAGQYFSVDETNTNPRDDALEVTLPDEALVYLFSDSEQKYSAMKWRTMFMQVDTYLLEKGKRR